VARRVDRLEALAGEIEAAGGRALALEADVTDQGQAVAAVARAAEVLGRLDTVVNNAGGTPYKLAADATPNFHAKITELNMLAPLLVSQEAYRIMERQPSDGSIVMVSSVSGRRPSPGSAAYGAAKAGLDSLVASLAVEWAPKVRVNSVVVGMVETEQSHLHYGDAEGIAAVGQTIPMGRLASPEEIGNCAAFLASPLSSYVTGAALLVHGGGERPAFLAAQTAQPEAATNGATGA
jgi:NAD(P)-dependent dehydrogenase (short-subunit alcohol dehydrogenase family)